MEKGMIYPTEESVLKAMKEEGLKTITMFHTTYVDHSNYQNYGYSVNNINSDYYYNQKIIEAKTQEFSVKHLVD